MAEIHIEIQGDDNAAFSLFASNTYELNVGSVSIHMSAEQFQQLCENLKPWVVDDERIAAALNAQAGVVEALRPLEEALARHDKAALADDHGKIAVAAHDLFDAARAALAAIKEKDRG